MGKKLYEKTETGGIRFSSGRKPGEVRVPNYVYDLWLPLLGAVAVGVYNLYCRLERENIVKAITLKNIANACRIGTGRLDKINEALKKCGFIEIAKPTGWKRLAHYTTEFKVLDPPREVPIWAIEEYAAERGYKPLTPWLVAEEIKTLIGSPENPSGFSGEPGQALDEAPNGTPKIATLGLQPSGVESLDVEADFLLKKPPIDRIVEAIIAQTETHPDGFDLARRTASARAASGNWSAPPSAGGDDGLAAFGLFCLYDKRGKQPPKRGTKEHKRQCERVAEALKAYGYQQADSQIVEKAAELLCERKGEWVNPFYPSFAADLGSALSEAEKLAKQLDAAPDRRARYDTPAVRASQAAWEERMAARPPPAGDDAAGRQIKIELQLQMAKATFDAYVKPAGFVCNDGVLTVTAPDAFIKGWLDSHLRQIIERTAVGVVGRPVEVRFEAGAPEEAE